MAAAKLAFFIFLVAGALSGLLDLHFMMGKLCRSLRSRSCHFTSRQGLTFVRAALAPPDSALRASLYSKVEGSPKA